MNPQLVATGQAAASAQPQDQPAPVAAAIAAELASQGLVNMHGRPYARASIQAMVQR